MMTGLLISLSLLLPLTDSLSAVERSYARGEKLRVNEGESAAAYLFGPDASYTGAAASWSYAKDPAPLVREEGKGLSEGQIHIATLVRLDSLSAVRGRVRYVNGVKRDVLWNSSSDYSTVYPYVMADTVGGDLRKEEYAFSAGYTARRGHFHWGVEGAYRALHEFRQADPRPRNIVSDLSIAASAGWRPVPGYVLDATLGYRRYSQRQTMSFLNARGKNTSILHLTGLGSHFSRFSGATDAYMDTRYAGNGITLSAAWVPLQDKGWNAAVSYRLLDLVHYLPNQNEVPYTELYTRTVNLSLHYLSRGGEVGWKAGVFARYQWRIGQESILDNGAAGYIKELARANMFNSGTLSAGVDGLLQWRQRWNLEARAAYSRNEENYAYPVRLMANSGLRAGLDAAYRRQSGPWHWKTALGGGLYRPMVGTLRIPEADTDARIAAYWQQHDARLRVASLDARLVVYAERQLSARLSLYVEASGRAVFPTGYSPAFYSTLSAGLNF